MKKDEGKNFISCDIMCSKTKCTFEFTLFEFKGISEQQQLPPGWVPRLGPSSSVGNIALIIPSQMLPELDRQSVQKFLDGNAAIRLQARVPGNPIEFILPPPRGN